MNQFLKILLVLSGLWVMPVVSQAGLELSFEEQRELEAVLDDSSADSFLLAIDLPRRAGFGDSGWRCDRETLSWESRKLLRFADSELMRREEAQARSEELYLQRLRLCLVKAYQRPIKEELKIRIKKVMAKLREKSPRTKTNFGGRGDVGCGWTRI